MQRILHLAPANAPEAVVRQLNALSSRLGEGFAVHVYREKNILGMIRRIKQQPVDQVHAWGIAPLLAAAMVFKGPIHFTPLNELTARQIRLLKSIFSYRPFHASMPSGLLADLWVGSGFSDKNVRMIPPGVDFSACKRGRDDSLRQSWGLTPDQIAVVSIAPNGHRDALWATAIMHQFDPRWVFLHPFKAADPVHDFAKKICGESVLKSAPADVPFETLLSASDFILSTSRDFCPPWPIAHAMAFGLPIIGWATRFNGEYLEHKNNALLAAPGAISDLARRMLEAKENASLQWKISDQARRTAYERCSMSGNIQGYREMYLKAGEKN